MEKIIRRFCLDGNAVSCSRYGSGHINTTCLLETDQQHRYILQKLNTHVFGDTQGLMENIAAVTDYLRQLTPRPRRVLTIVPTLDGGLYHETDKGECWRVFEFIEGGVCLEQARNAEEFRQSGRAFGQFQKQLAEFPVERLKETIPQFHDTPNRFRQLHEAIAADKAGRLVQVQPEVDAYLACEKAAAELTDMQRAGLLPLRVCHNDAKLSNVILDAETHEPLCVIDLDTVMPGLAAYDFGDSIRYGASTAAEDEPDQSRVALSMTLYRAYAEGFLSACAERLTKAEIASLPLGAKTITLENGVRFLTDYLNGDEYYQISRSSQNLDRCRTHLTLVRDMEARWQEMQAAVAPWL